MKINQKGFTAVEVIIIVFVVGLIGAIGWLVYDRQKSKTPNSSVSQVDTTQKPKSSDTEKQVNPNEGYLVLDEWDLRFKIPSGLKDIRYAIHDDTVAFFAKPSDADVQYVQDYDSHNEDGYFSFAQGVLYRSKDSTKERSPVDTVQGKKIGDYYYYTAWSFSGLATGAACVGLYGDSNASCEIENKVFGLVNQGDSALLNTIEPAK